MIGAPINDITYAAISFWADSEGMPPGEHNPLATTLNCCGGVNVNSDGVKSYPTVQDGAHATAATLHGIDYTAIVSAFQAGNDSGKIWEAINRSPWCSGCQHGKYPIVLYDHLGVGKPPPGGGGGGGGGGGNPQSGKHWSALVNEWSWVQHTAGQYANREVQNYVRQADRIKRLAKG